MTRKILILAGDFVDNHGAGVLDALFFDAGAGRPNPKDEDAGGGQRQPRLSGGGDDTPGSGEGEKRAPGAGGLRQQPDSESGGQKLGRIAEIPIFGGGRAGRVHGASL